MRIKYFIQKLMNIFKTQRTFALKIDSGPYFNSEINDFEFKVQYLNKNIWITFTTTQILQHKQLKYNFSVEDLEFIIRHNERLKKKQLGIKSILRTENGTSLFLLKDFNTGRETLHSAENILKYKIFSSLSNIDEAFSLGYKIAQENEAMALELRKQHIKTTTKSNVYEIKKIT